MRGLNLKSIEPNLDRVQHYPAMDFFVVIIRDCFIDPSTLEIIKSEGAVFWRTDHGSPDRGTTRHSRWDQIGCMCKCVCSGKLWTWL